MPFPLDIRFVRDTEQKLGRRFPLSFVSRMLQSNGGTVSVQGETWFLFPFFDTTDKKRIARTCNDIIRETRSNQDRPGFPANAVAIAENGGGAFLLLLPDDAASDRFGDTIYFWERGSDVVSPVADDFYDLR